MPAALLAFAGTAAGATTIAAGAGLAGAALSASATKSAAKKASDAATYAADQNTALAREQYGKNEGYLQPSINRGNAAGANLQALLGLGGDAAAARGAFDTWRDSTDFDFVLDQGEKSVLGNRAASHLLDSGQTLKALQSYGQNTARSYINQYEGLLDNQQKIGLQGAGYLAGQGGQMVSTIADANDSRASAIGNSAIASANSTNQLIGQLLSAGATYLGSRSPTAGAAAGTSSYTPINMGMPNNYGGYSASRFLVQ